MKKKVNELTPEIYTGLKLKKPQVTAAGIPGVKASLQHILGEMRLSTGYKVLNKLNQFDGTDCPGCAWPDPDDHRSGLGEYCENGVKAIAEEATYKKVDPAFFAQYTVGELSEKSDFWLGKRGRISHPMILREGQEKYEEISWEGAFDFISQELKTCQDPNEAIFYTSGRTSNEAAFLYQLFVRMFGTNNLPDCSNMCHESSGVALSETLGIGKGSVKLEDFYQTDLILVIGQNPGTNHPRMLSALKKAKESGAKIISINPILETGLLNFKHPQSTKDILGKGTALSDLYLQVKINEDVALLKCIMLLMLGREDRKRGQIFDWDFIEKNSLGVEEFIEDLRQQDLAKLAKQSGVPFPQIEKAARMIMDSPKMICCWAMGLTQHENGVHNIQEVVNLLLLKGSIGKPGAGTCPVRGHSNVQGDRTMGIWEKPKAAFLDKLQEVFDFEPPRDIGFNTVEAIEVMHDFPGKVFFAMGGNFLSAAPDTKYTAKALQNCRLTVHVSTKLNRSHLVHGTNALILPCKGRTEIDEQASGKQFVSVENSMGVVHSSRGMIPPSSEHLLSEPDIIAKLAKASLGDSDKIKWLELVEDYDRIRDMIEAVIPGFEDYNKRVRQTGGFYLPNCARDGDFKTLTGKANFKVIPLPQHKLKQGEFLMMTIRSHDQFNTTIYGLDDRYRGIFNERRIVMMNKEDMVSAGLKSGDKVDLINQHDNVERIAPGFIVVPYDIPSQNVATYFPEANVLVPIKQIAKRSHTPASKSVKVIIQKQ